MDHSTEDKKTMQIKGIGSSPTIVLDPGLPIEDLKQELRRIFDPIRDSCVDGNIVLDPGDRPGRGDLVRELGAFLKAHYRVGTVTEPPGKPEATAAARERQRLREMDGGLFHRTSDVLMMTGLVRSGQKINAKKHFLLLGDLNPGGEVIAGGDILILGSLRGKAIAGHPDNDHALILALDFRPTQIQIGGFVAAGLPPSKAKTTEFAQVHNGAIVVDDYIKANPFAGRPWPEVR